MIYDKWRTGSKANVALVNIKIAGIYGCELPTNIDNNMFWHTPIWLYWLHHPKFDDERYVVCRDMEVSWHGCTPKWSMLGFSIRNHSAIGYLDLFMEAPKKSDVWKNRDQDSAKGNPWCNLQDTGRWHKLVRLWEIFLTPQIRQAGSYKLSW